MLASRFDRFANMLAGSLDLHWDRTLCPISDYGTTNYIDVQSLGISSAPMTHICAMYLTYPMPLVSSSISMSCV